MGVAGGEVAFADGGLDDVGGGAVLDAAAGVDPLDFAEELDAGEVGGEFVEAQEGRVADAVEEADAERDGDAVGFMLGVIWFIEGRSGDVRQLDHGEDESCSYV